MKKCIRKRRNIRKIPNNKIRNVPSGRSKSPARFLGLPG